MRVYLDNNILISIEDDEISLDIFKNIDKNYSYVYSYAHIQELIEVKSNFDELKKIRLKTILDLTNNTYIYPDNNQINSKIENPEKVILTLKMFSGLMEMTRQAVNNYNIDRLKLIGLLGIDQKRINNYTPTEVIEYIDKAINNRLLIGINNLIDLSGISLRERINTLFNLLDFVGFWKDKKTERSNLARMYDASHTYFSSYCDLFVSNDLRARNKAKVAYEIYKINTKVLSLDEFLI
ncbi:hypothetical protein ACE01N_20115 [Saccharicrinis sp. FJH2]|uniref:hypothetical protein n=1 Tax=Saccharicrinis sp. FJH65 TaxID=3344659 RepID=UPI0035F414D5